MFNNYYNKLFIKYFSSTFYAIPLHCECECVLVCGISLKFRKEKNVFLRSLHLSLSLSLLPRMSYGKFYIVLWLGNK